MDEQRMEVLGIGALALLVGFAMGCATTSPAPVAAVATPIGFATLSRDVRLSTRATFIPDQSSPVISSGTRVDLLQAINAFEGNAQLYRVRTPDGRVGYATILPGEIVT